jgi:Glycosyltransferase family 87
VTKTDRIPWIGVLAMFAIVGLFATRDLASPFNLGGGIGWDLRVLCAAFAALSEGKDPYYVVTEGLSLPHAIVPAYPAKFLCPMHAARPRAYVIIYLLLFVSSCAALAYFLLRNLVETILVTIVSVCAFAAFRSLAASGNIVILEVPFAALSILAVHHRRFVLAGVALGLMSSLKMLPLVGVLAFLILPVGWGQRVRAVAASLLTFGAVQLINLMISGPYGLSFLKMLVGQIPTSPYFETSRYNPDFIDFVFHVFGRFGIQKETLMASAIGLFALAIGGWVTMLAQQMNEADRFAGLSHLYIVFVSPQILRVCNFGTFCDRCCYVSNSNTTIYRLFGLSFDAVDVVRNRQHRTHPPILSDHQSHNVFNGRVWAGRICLETIERW